MMNPPKERKYVQCFKSNKDGSCNWCKTRSWKQGYKIYAMKKGDGKWIACTDRQCYLEQGGELTIFRKEETPQTEQTNIINLKLTPLGEHLKGCKYCQEHFFKISTHMVTGVKLEVENQ